MNGRPTIRVFVYGSLKRGGEYHARFARHLTQVTPAAVTGRLYQHPSGYPMLVVPKTHVLAKGTAQLTADCRTWETWSVRQLDNPQVPDGNDWEPVLGELLTFEHPQQQLRELDWLEDFRAAGDSLYERVIVTAEQTTGGVAHVAAWCYVAPGGTPPPGSLRIGPVWPQHG